MSVDDFVRAWAPDNGDPYPADVEVGVDPADDRRILTIIRFDGDMQAFQQAMPRLIHPESHRRVDELVESTELESVYETVAVTV
ncbi:hypothetical protein [Nocardia sp.]|uniref:hypothetical protein n=1 Tax=Nocardia sp. TaxID=1821 RepID=UPI0026285FA7|nr:hypothetical protein [Nocardia sp.]